MCNRTLVHAMLATALMALGSAAIAQTKIPPPAQQATGPQPILRANFIAQMDAPFGKMDADKNGQVTRAEVEQFERQRALAETQARNEALFDQLDVNKNGQLSAKEFAKLVTEPAVSAQPMLSREDSNRDGQISLLEHRAATVANFDRIDTNRDGVVSVTEMAAGGIAPR
ncbi:MAG: EF-hand domain-containing protein [Pseudomonadota bacterium]|nr:EF-hand domain-containing protein [Pseudomonadota bacterium]